MQHILTSVSARSQGDVCGFNIINQYLCYIHKLLDYQKESQINKLTHEDLNSMNIQLLMKNVRS